MALVRQHVYPQAQPSFHTDMLPKIHFRNSKEQESKAKRKN